MMTLMSMLAMLAMPVLVALVLAGAWPAIRNVVLVLAALAVSIAALAGSHIGSI